MVKLAFLLFVYRTVSGMGRGSVQVSGSRAPLGLVGSQKSSIPGVWEWVGDVLRGTT